MSRKAIIPIVAALLVAAIGIYLYKREPANPNAGFVTQVIGRGRIEAKVTATGTVSPLVTVLVGSQISGRVVALYADFNSKVKKGEVIAKLDTSLLEAGVQQSRANLLAAEGNLAKAKAQAVDAGRQATRSAELAGKKLVSQADSDTADTNRLAMDAGVKAAEGQVALAKAGLDQSRINLQYATIYSPINGVVIQRSVDVGQTVAAAMTAPTLFQIAEDLQKMQVDTSVAESDVGKITTDMEVSFTVDAYPTERFKGKVRQVRNAPTNVQNVVTYDGVVDVLNPEFKLKPGMTANVSFVYAERKDVLRLPAAALRFQMPEQPGDKAAEKTGPKTGSNRQKPAPNAAKLVWVMRGTPPNAVQVPVHVGISDGSFIEVLDGLSEGDLVITDSNDPDVKKPATPTMGGPGGGGRRGF